MIWTPRFHGPGPGVQSLTGELRSCNLHAVAEEEKKEKRKNKSLSNQNVPRLNKGPKGTILFRINQLCKRSIVFTTLIELC